MSSEKTFNFKVLPLRFSPASTSYHSLFFKEHIARKSDDNTPIGQTLFVLNIPPYVTAEGLKGLFSSAGKIINVILEDDILMKNDGFKRGYIVFKSREVLLKALNLKKLNLLSSDDSPLNVGVAKWVNEYNESIISHDKLQNEIDVFMNSYNENEKNRTETADEDGWTVVSKGGRNAALPRKESVLNNIESKNAKKMKKKELKNFYTFQIRESQMKNIAELRKNYEEAKNKVKLMKAARKFKPY